MKIAGLRYIKKVRDYPHLEDEFDFIYSYGAFNCKILKLKDAETVIDIMNNIDIGNIDDNQKNFIIKNSGKPVLCYICDRGRSSSIDIFIYGDNNMPFTIDCFV